MPQRGLQKEDLPDSAESANAKRITVCLGSRARATKKFLKLGRERLSFGDGLRRCRTPAYLDGALMGGMVNDGERWRDSERRRFVAAIDIRHEVNVAYHHAIPNV